MIRDVMVRLDGGEPDELRLSAANAIAQEFGSRIIGLFINELRLLIPEEGGAAASPELLNRAREAGDELEEELEQRLVDLQKPFELRRYDILSDAAGDVAAREARTADAFVALRPNGAPQEPAKLIERVLFGCGRHLLLVPEGIYGTLPFKHVMLAWSGSRESARADREQPGCQHASGCDHDVLLERPRFMTLTYHYAATVRRFVGAGLEKP